MSPRQRALHRGGHAGEGTEPVPHAVRSVQPHDCARRRRLHRPHCAQEALALPGLNASSCLVSRKVPSSRLPGGQGHVRVVLDQVVAHLVERLVLVPAVAAVVWLHAVAVGLRHRARRRAQRHAAVHAQHARLTGGRTAGRRRRSGSAPQCRRWPRGSPAPHPPPRPRSTARRMLPGLTTQGRTRRPSPASVSARTCSLGPARGQ